MPSSPTLTIGIPAFNAGASIETAIRSILRQSWRGTMEILIVDDGSTDDTVAIASRMAERYGTVRVVRHDRNRGRPTARNTILREARGRYLTWMDADDEWYPNKLAVQFDRLFAYEATAGTDPRQPVVCMCAFDWQWTHSSKPSHRTPDINGDQLKGLLAGRIGAYLWTMLGTLQAFRDVGEFDDKLPRLQDLDFTIRFVARGGRLIMSDPRMPLCLYHKDDDGKPGRVIAESLAHIRAKHRPLFLQYGPRFLRASRRQHFLLVARHGYRNEGWLFGRSYSALASLVVPGRLVGQVMRALRLSPPIVEPRPPKLDTVRDTLPDLTERARNIDGSARVDLLVMTSPIGAEELRVHLRTLGPAARQDGLWYPSPSAIAGDLKRRDHAELYDLMRDDPVAGRAAAGRLARMAATSNGDGRSSILYLGAPLDLDVGTAAEVENRAATLRAALEAIAGAMQEAQVDLHVHLVVPDSETLLWRRYALAFDQGQDIDFDRWLSSQPAALARVLDLRALAPVGAVGDATRLHLHLLGEGSTLDGLRRSILATFGKSAPWPTAATFALGAPTRHGGLPVFERLLQRYRAVLRAEGFANARQRFWQVPADEQPPAPSAASLDWLRRHGDWRPPALRFPAAQCHVVGPASETRHAPEQFRYPVASIPAFERSLAELHTLGAVGAFAA